MMKVVDVNMIRPQSAQTVLNLAQNVISAKPSPLTSNARNDEPAIVGANTNWFGDFRTQDNLVPTAPESMTQQLFCMFSLIGCRQANPSNADPNPIRDTRRPGLPTSSYSPANPLVGRPCRDESCLNSPLLEPASPPAHSPLIVSLLGTRAQAS